MDILHVINKTWEEAGWNHSQSAMTTQVSFSEVDDVAGVITGTGVWGTDPCTFSISVTDGWSCTCPRANLGIQKDVGACPHIMRAIVEMEAMLNEESFQETFDKRIINVMPF